MTQPIHKTLFVPWCYYTCFFLSALMSSVAPLWAQEKNSKIPDGISVKVNSSDVVRADLFGRPGLPPGGQLLRVVVEIVNSADEPKSISSAEFRLTSKGGRPINPGVVKLIEVDAFTVKEDVKTAKFSTSRRNRDGIEFGSYEGQFGPRNGSVTITVAPGKTFEVKLGFAVPAKVVAPMLQPHPLE